METRSIELSAESVSNYCGQRRSESDLDSDVMSFETFMQQLQALNSSLETLAAIGAELRLRRDGLAGDARVRSLLQEEVHRIDPTAVEVVPGWQAKSKGGCGHWASRASKRIQIPPRSYPHTRTTRLLVAHHGKNCVLWPAGDPL